MSLNLTRDLTLPQLLILGGTFAFLIVLAHAHRPTIGESPEARVARRYQAQVADYSAIDLSFENKEKVRKTLKDFKGRVVLLNFWATWCAPCLKEMPDLEKLAQKMKGHPFTMIALSSDEEWTPIQQVIGPNPLNMQVYRDPSTTSKQHLRYGTQKLPETYVIDKQGQVRLRFINVQPWQDEEIQGYLEWLSAQ